MQALLEFAPLAAFFATYLAAGLYAATAVLMGGMTVLLLVDYARQRRIPSMHALSAALVFLFGTATLVLHNQRFIQWKPTVFCWLASLAFLASRWMGERTLAQRFLSAALQGEDARIPQPTWRALNWLWVAFYALLGAANLYVAFNASERTWVYFKVVGTTVATLVFMIGQVLWLSRRLGADSTEPSTSA
ncbi:MAG TPA: inner membrane-spanning protein YciB [Steroidobacteraceae bacterium]|nr:inner membrane-spanning protein YciB [Steroidobacteraceae bacterium]